MAKTKTTLERMKEHGIDFEENTDSKGAGGRPKKDVVLTSGNYCRYCMRIKDRAMFLSAVDNFLDKNGKMSICKSCVAEIYENIYQAEKDLEKTVLKCCRILNVKYSEEAIRAAEIQFSKQQISLDSGSFFGIYKAKLVAVQRREIGHRIQEDLTFSEPFAVRQKIDDVDDVDNYEEESNEELDYLKQFWGDHYNISDLYYLEREFNEWKKTHKSDTKAEETLLKELCYKSLEIKDARINQKSTTTLVNDLQTLMKTASVDPSKTAVAGSGKSQDTFSSFIKTIEENEPAEIFENKKLFSDFDNIDWYFRKYVVRPLKNFITQSRDFNVEVDDGVDELEEGFGNDEISASVSE